MNRCKNEYQDNTGNAFSDENTRDSDHSVFNKEDVDYTAGGLVTAFSCIAQFIPLETSLSP